ncbi:rhodanese-like domain-containing protein [Candidatus Entotheonella palauensis]|uniref:rhodanese-like domain-containing protein n=1 Tax=Candidatus Entotheonella palauensis TaxID=93172 RepID=UPI000B7CCE3A|nr:rhodanese-like domain-containing protein [Candidatus Entotheonella palauensis]
MSTLTMPSSQVLATPAAACDDAQAFFQQKLRFETDPADVYTDMKNGVDDFILLDVRSPEAYAKSHAIGALNLPSAKIDATTTVDLPPGKLLVVYCWGPGCNGATKAAMKLSALGFAVKEMIGGIEYWEDRERYPIERGV